jgi:hypothetical protein
MILKKHGPQVSAARQESQVPELMDLLVEKTREAQQRR